MQAQITLTYVQLIDVCLRLSTVGVLVLVGLMAARATYQTKANTALAACLIGYILLTAPIENEHYGLLRPLLLLLTDCTAYSLLAVYWQRVHRHSIFKKIPTWGRIATVAWFCWMAVFFFAFDGRGIFHDILHMIGMFVLFFILIDAVRDFTDDLNENRRGFRKRTIVVISLYSFTLTLVEVFYQPLKDHWAFSLTNAMLMFVLTVYFAYVYSINQETKSNVEVANNEPRAPSINPDIDKLHALMQPDFFCQNALTVSKMAQAMTLPEHQLRSLINIELGFDNFSKFLNSYRIPLVCEQLVHPSQKATPILTLALNAGFNSIAPFNRAFKEFTGTTPTEYRKLNT